MNFQKSFNNQRIKIIQRLSNTDKLYSIGDSAVISLGRFGAGIALAKLSGAEAFAQYLLLMTAGFFLLSIPSTLCIIPMVNIASGLSQFKRAGIFHWTHKKLRWFFAGGAILSIIAFPIAHYFSISPIYYFGFICATLTGLELLYQRAILQVSFKMKVAVLSDFLGLLILISAVALSWHLYQAPTLGFWWGSTIASIAASSSMRLGRRGITITIQEKKSSEPNLETQKHAVSSGGAMLVGSIANSACSKLAPFVLGSIGGLLTVASFGASWTLIGPLRMLSGAIGGILRPRLAMHTNTSDSASFKRSLQTAYILIGSVGISGILVSLVLGPTLVSFLFEPSLRSAGYLLPLAMLYATLDVITTTQAIALQTKLKKGAFIASKLRIIAAIISVSLIYPACIWLGALGAYLTLLVSEIVYFYQAHQFLKKSKHKQETITEDLYGRSAKNCIQV